MIGVSRLTSIASGHAPSVKTLMGSTGLSKIYINPTKGSMRTFFASPGLLYVRLLVNDGDTYFWDALDLTHEDLISDLYLEGKSDGYEFPRRILEECGFNARNVVEGRKGKHVNIYEGSSIVASKHISLTVMASGLPKVIEGPKCKIYQNPTKDMFKRLTKEAIESDPEWRSKIGGSVRGLFTKDGDYYFWNSAKSVHADVIRDLTLGAALAVDIDAVSIEPKGFDWRLLFKEYDRGIVYNGEGFYDSRLKIHVASSTPSLTSAVMYKGKILYGNPGELHSHILRRLVPALTPPQRMLALDAPGSIIFITQNGRKLNRVKALEFAKENDLIDADSKYYEYGSSGGLISEMLKASKHVEASLIDKENYIFKNPSAAEFDAVSKRDSGGSVRYLKCTDDNSLYIWPGYDVLHWEVLQYLGKSVNDVSLRGEIKPREDGIHFEPPYNTPTIRQDALKDHDFQRMIKGKTVVAGKVAGKVLQTYLGKIFENPSKDQMRSLYNSTVRKLNEEGYSKTSEEYYIRLLKTVDPEGKSSFYAWEGWNAIHFDVLKYLKSQAYFIQQIAGACVMVKDMEKYGFDALTLFNTLCKNDIVGRRVASIPPKAVSVGLEKVFINPTRAMMGTLCEKLKKREFFQNVRAIRKDNDIYVWDAYKLYHMQAAYELGIEPPFELYGDDDNVIYVSEIFSYKGDIRRVMEDRKREGKFSQAIIPRPIRGVKIASSIPKVLPLRPLQKVFRNPTKGMIQFLAKSVVGVTLQFPSGKARVRGLWDSGNRDLYLWDASFAIHLEVSDLLGIARPFGAFEIDASALEVCNWDLAKILEFGEIHGEYFEYKDHDYGMGKPFPRFSKVVKVAGIDLRADIVVRGRPAVRYRDRVYAGQRGEYHALICAKNDLPGKSQVERGYVLDGKFIPDDSLDRGIDSSELMSPMQKMRVDQDLVADWRSR